MLNFHRNHNIYKLIYSELIHLLTQRYVIISAGKQTVLLLVI